MIDDNTNHSQTAAFIWSVVDLLRGDFKQSQYGRVILPFTLLRRLECVLESTKAQVLATALEHQAQSDTVLDKLLLRAADQQFFNASPLNLASLSDSQTADDLMSYVQSFSQDAREVFEQFHFEEVVLQLSANGLLYQVVQRFGSIDLSPKSISNFGMGIIFDELIRKFLENANEAAVEHFTPRDIVHLTTSLVLTGQENRLTPNSIVTIYDPTAGAGGFLSEADGYIQQISENVTVSLHGQEVNPESYAICKAKMLIKGRDVTNIKLGNTLSDDQLATNKFDLMLSNPPFGVEWTKVQKQVVDEHNHREFDGRFGPGLPRVSDGSLLFLMHLVSKMRDAREGGSRIGIILNGSPLVTGGAGSGESEIRRYLLQNDMVEAIVALPTEVFYNTGISTYVWVLCNNKEVRRKDKVQLIDATDCYSKMRKPIGSKRQYVSGPDRAEILKTYVAFEETEKSKIFPTLAFGYRRITVERPLKANFQTSEERIGRILDERAIQNMGLEDQEKVLEACRAIDADTVYRNRKSFQEALQSSLIEHQVYPNAPQLKSLFKALSERDPRADTSTDNKGNVEPDTGLRSYEKVPLTESVHDYFEREVAANITDAWIDESKLDEQDSEVGIVGYEINFNTYFLKDKIDDVLNGSPFQLIKIANFTSLVKDGSDDWDVTLNLRGIRNPLARRTQYSFSKDLGVCFLKIDKNIVKVGYFERFLGSSLWDAIVYKVFIRGTKVPTFNDVKNISIPVPSLELQEKYERFFNAVEKEQVRLEDSKKRVWFDANYLNFSPEEKTKFDRFVDVIPYPLANMLHHRENSDAGTDKENYEIALKFMEAAAQYLCACVVGICHYLKVDVSGTLHERRGKLCRGGASFGYWVWMLARLRDQVKESSENHGPWSEFLESKGPIFGAIKHLEEARDIRNSKVGHGVYPTQSEAQKTLEGVERCLESFTTVSVAFFEAVELVRVGNCRMYPERYEVDVDIFSGLVSYPFAKNRVSSNKALHFNELHIHYKEYEVLVQIPQLVTLEVAVKEGDLKGFYFLSSENTEKEELVYVCYQQLPLQSKSLSNKSVDPFFI